MGSQDVASHPDMDWLPKKDRAVVPEKLEEGGLLTEMASKNVDYYNVGCLRGRRPENAGSPFHYGVEG